MKLEFFSSDFRHSKLAGSKEEDEERDMPIHPGPAAGRLRFLQLFLLPEGSEKVAAQACFYLLFAHFPLIVGTSISPEKELPSSSCSKQGQAGWKSKM